MTCIDIHNQTEYDARKNDQDACLHLVEGNYTEISGSARVGYVRGSARVESVGDSASVGAAGTAVVHAYGGTVTAAQHVTTYRHDPDATIHGGHIVEIPALDTIETWAAYSGIPIVDGHLVVFKAVNEDLVSGHGTKYPAGETVTAPDWQPTSDCGNGLHFSPHPLVAATYLYTTPMRFLACQVAAHVAVVIDAEKIKAPSCEVLYEVTPSGDRIPEPETTTP